jgi:hypothetical protein
VKKTKTRTPKGKARLSGKQTLRHVEPINAAIKGRAKTCGDYGHRTSRGPCKAYPIAGGRVCKRHGGASPQVRRKAAERLQDLIDPDRTLRELARIAFSDLRVLFDRNGNLLPVSDWPEEMAPAIKKIEIVKRNLDVGDGLMDEVHKVETWDKLKALELIGKNLGLFTEKIEHSGGIDVSWDEGPAEEGG